MKRQRPPTLDLDDEDEGDEFKPLFDYSETMGPAPTFLSDDSDDDDVVITAGPPQLRPKISPAKEPPTGPPRKGPASKVILEDDDESWLMPSPAKLPSPAKRPTNLPFPGNHTVQALRSKRMELMMLQQRASPDAIRKVEEQARMQAQRRPEVVQSPLVVKTPNSSKVHGKSPVSEAGEKEKILIKVQNKDGDIQPIRIFMTDNFEKLFRVYAEVAEVPLANLSFRFDGDQLSPNSTPNYHGMEDSELIEVYNKS